MVHRERKPSTVHVGNHPSCLSFSGCGFLGIYHIGVASCFRHHAPEFLKNLKRIYGCSAGSIVGAMLLNDVCCGEVCKSTLEIVNNIRSRYLGPLSPGFKINKILREGFEKNLPKDAHIRTSGRLYISLTRLSDMKNVIVCDYATRGELIDALLCSCFVPFYSGFMPPKYRGVYYVDGGLSNNLPTDPDTITVSPWSGGSDICPKDNSAISLIDINLVNTSVQMTVKNLYRFSTMFFPPEGKILSDFCEQGFRETLQYLLEHGLLETAYPTSEDMPDLHNNQQMSLQVPDITSNKRLRTQSTVRFYIEDFEQESVVTDDSGVSESTSSTSESSIEVNLQQYDNDSSEDSKEKFDANHNEDVELSEKETSPTQRGLISVPSVTVMKMHPVEERTLILHFTLPVVVVQALEESHLTNSSCSWRTPVSKFISVCGKTLIVRMPLYKSYEIACALLENVSAVPDNVKWLINYVHLFVSMLHAYFQVKGSELILKLQSAKNSLSEDLEVLSYKMGVLIQILLQNMLEQGCIQTLSWVLKTSAQSLTCSKLTSVLSS